MDFHTWRGIQADVYSDSILKYLTSGYRVGINLNAIRGGKIKDVTKAISKTSETDAVLIHVGTNDLSDSQVTMTGLEKDYSMMFETLAYHYSCPVIVSGILPRLDRPDLEPLRVAVNNLLGSLVAKQAISSDQSFSFVSWDEECSGFDFFSLDGLHPSRPGNSRLHEAIRSHLQWMLSEERIHSRTIVNRMICSELRRTRRTAQKRSAEKRKRRHKRDNMVQQRSGPKEVTRCRQYTRPQVRRQTHVHLTTKTKITPLKVSVSDTLLDVAGRVVVCPRLSGWGLRKAQKKISKTAHSHKIPARPSCKKPDARTACPYCQRDLPHNYLLDHFLMKHHEGRSKKHSSKTRDRRATLERREDIGNQVGGGRTRTECLEISFSVSNYSVREVSVICDESDAEYSNVFHLQVLPSLTQLEELRTMLTNRQKQDQRFYYIIFENGSKFRLQELSQAIQMHYFKADKVKVIQEKFWLNQKETTIVAKTPLSASLLKNYSDIIFNNPLDSSVTINNDVIRVEDLVTLTKTEWLSNFFCMSYISKLNQQCLNSICHFLHSLESIPQSVSHNINKLAKREGKDRQLIFNFLVATRGSRTYFTPSANHFVFTIYILDENRLIYADSMGGNIPEGYLDQFKKGLTHCGVNSNDLTVTFCHDPFSRDGCGTHVCSSNCAPFYPLQTCHSICGIAAIIGYTIAVLRPDILKIMMQTTPNSEEIYPVDYLRDISSHSSFLRKVVIHWIMSPQINLSLLFKATMSLHEITATDCNQTVAIKQTKAEITNKLKQLNSSTKQDSSLDDKAEITNKMKQPNSSTKQDSSLDDKAEITNKMKQPNSSTKQDSSLDDKAEITNKMKQSNSSTKQDSSLDDKAEITNKMKQSNSSTKQDSSLDDKAEITNIMKQPNSSTQQDFSLDDKAEISNKMKQPNSSTKQDSSLDDKAEITNKMKQLNSSTKQDSSLDDTHSISKLGTNDKTALQSVTKKINKWCQLLYDPLLIKLLKIKPTVHFKAKEKRLTLRLFPKNSKRGVVKTARCSDEGLKDQLAMAEINAFLQSDECKSKVESLNIKKKVAIKSDDGGKENKEIKVADIKTGDTMKEYLDMLPFDTIKSFLIHGSVEASYQGTKTLRASVISNPKWGKTHREDEQYSFKDKQPDKNIKAVQLLVRCSGKTRDCRTKCGNLISELNRDKGVTSCSGCGVDVSTIIKTCFMCSVDSSVRWYKYSSKDSSTTDIDGQTLCNTCYRYVLKYKRQKPKQLIKHNNHNKINHPHYQCGWQINCIIFSNNLDSWKIFEEKDGNKQFHRNTPFQEHKRPSLTDRDEIDKMRVSNKISANQVKLSFQREQSVHIGDNANFKQLRELISKDQIQNRIKQVDKHIIRGYIEKLDEIPLAGSDWRNAEKIMEQNSNSVLLFQRGVSNRNYHFILANNKNVEFIQLFGQHIIGYDNKYDLTSVRFPVGLLTVCDMDNKGKAVAISMSNSDEAETHALTFKIILLNVPCSNDSCDHKQELYVFKDGNGFFKFRPCSLINPPTPMVQHDKDSSIKSAVSSIGLNSSLCNFHALQAFRRHINEEATLKMFIRPLETGFKTIMRAWSNEIRRDLITNYITIINSKIPSQLLPQDIKVKFVNYLQKNWFMSNWSSAFTAEVLYSVPVEERRNPLILTDNVTERKFRDIDESSFNSHLNKSVSTLVIKMIDPFLYSEGKLHVAVTGPIVRKATVRNVEKEYKCAEKGLYIVQEGRLIKDKQWTEHGWFGIAFDPSYCLTEPKFQTLPDVHFVGIENTLNDTSNDVELIFEQPDQTKHCDLSKLSQQITQEHCYDVQSKCKQLLSKLEFEQASSWHRELFQSVPVNLRDLYDLNTCQYLCNINLGVCSCYGFIIRGQPYFCKHLYAGFSEVHNIMDVTQLVSLYKQHSPSFIPDTGSVTVNSNLTVHLATCINSLKEQSEKASKEQTEMKSFLKLLHDKSLLLNPKKGSLAKRQPHNLGNRRKEGPIKDNKYSLVAPDGVENISKCDLDPYRPQVNFPDRAKERHGGRKRAKPSGRGVNFAHMVKAALDCLNHKLHESIDNTSIPDCDHEDENNCTSLPQSESNEEPTTVPALNTDAPITQLKNKTTSSKEGREGKHLILCGSCIKNKSPNPFACASKQEMGIHYLDVHADPYLCMDCFQEFGILKEIKHNAEFKHHIKEVHSKKSGHNKQSDIDAKIHRAEKNQKKGRLSLCKKRKATSIDQCPSEPKAAVKEVHSKKSEHNKQSDIDAKIHRAEKNQKKGRLSLCKKRKATSIDQCPSEPKAVKWPCPVCEQECTDNPPSVGCDLCNAWSHFKCAGIDKTPSKNENWYCQSCRNQPSSSLSLSV